MMLIVCRTSSCDAPTPFCILKVYAIAFNNPYGDKVVTGSFDKTAKLWDAYTGQLYYTLKGGCSTGFPYRQ